MNSFCCVLVGNEPLTVECGKRLLAAGHRIRAVATQRALVADWAREAGLDVSASIAALANSDDPIDWLFSIANLDMIPPHVLARAKKGAINFHDGPLPRYAGLNAPVWALLAGETTHGITWHLMEEGADTGDILVTREVAIASDETAFTLNVKCFSAGVESFETVLDEIAAGLSGRRSQDMSQRSYFGLKDKPNGIGWIDPTLSGEKIARQVRALDHGDHDNPVAAPWVLTGNGPILVGQAEAAQGTGAPGQVLTVDATSITLAVADGALRLSGLHSPLGAEIDPTKRMQAGDRLETPELDPDVITRLATHEPLWRKRLADYRPADWPTSGADHRGMASLALEAGSADHLHMATAFGAVIAAACGESVDLALHWETTSVLDAGWAPLRFEAGGTWGEAVATMARDMEAAGFPEHPASFTANLPARIAGLTRQRPMAGISRTGAIPGASLTFVPEARRIEVDTNVITKAEADLIVARVAALLAADIADDTPCPDLPLLPETERRQLIEGFNDTAQNYPADVTTHAAFEAQAGAIPDETALVFENTALSYGELNARANRLAHVLQEMGVGPASPVGLHMTRSENMVIAALAILKAGGAYVPLDPDYPADRIAFYATDSQAKVIVSEEGISAVVPDGATRILADTDPRIAAAPDTNPDSGVTGEDLAYLIYTSGSTGTPKGVMIAHRNVQNFFTGMDERIAHDPGSVWLAVTSLSFDISVLELFWTLARGFKVVLLGDEKLVANETGSVSGGMDFSLFYWGNDDGVGRDKYDLLLEGAKFADENGFQAVWTPERHFHAFGGLYPNPSVTGAAVAAVTRNIGVRAGSCVAPLHHPARIAEEWAVIDNLTDGRAGLAFASGWQPDDFVLRPENAPPDNKPAMLKAIEDVRALWRGDALTMTKADGSEVARLTQPRPVSKELPVWVTTAGNPDTWVEAGRIGANVLTHLLGQSIDEVGQKIGLYHAALREAGHDPKDFNVTLMLHTFLAEDREQARDIARAPMKDYLRSAAALIKQYAWAFPAFKRPEGMDSAHQIDLGGLEEDELDAILDFAFERYFERSGLFGTVEDALNRVAEIKAVGVTEVAALIDFGIERQIILEGLHHLAKVRVRANRGAAEDDFSIAAQIARHGVTHLQCTPYMARMLVENDEAKASLSKVKHLMIGGEIMPTSLVADLGKTTAATIENMYGPTETTIWSSTGPGKKDTALVPVGTPIANTRFYVLNDAMQPVGIGQVGQLWIGGGGVALGYWQRPDLTAEKFVDNPFHGGRMFGTGDLARWRPDGTLDVLGRADSQVKIRGYRIEIGEIESKMEKIEGVTQAVAVVRPDSSGVGQIHGYVTGSADAETVRTTLLDSLPAFMVPTQITRLETFPLTPNRKIDRKALPMATEPPATPVRAETAPSTEAGGPAVSMEAIAAIWQRVLNMPAVRPSDNFFDLGGHSLLAIEAHKMMKAELGLRTLSIADFFRAPTLGGLHGVLSARSTTQTISPTEPEPAKAAATRPVEDTLVSRRRAMRASRTAGT